MRPRTSSVRASLRSQTWVRSRSGASMGGSTRPSSPTNEGKTASNRGRRSAAIQSGGVSVPSAGVTFAARRSPVSAVNSAAHGAASASVA